MTSMTVDLGWLGYPRVAKPRGLAHRLFYLPPSGPDVTGQVVMVERETTRGVNCVVFAGPVTDHSRRVAVPARLWRTAVETVVVDAGVDPDTYAIVWQAITWRRYGGGRPAVLARVLVEQLRTPGTIEVDVNLPSSRRLMFAAHMLTVEQTRHLRRFVDAGMLIETKPPAGDHLGSYTLSIVNEALPFAKSEAAAR